MNRRQLFARTVGALAAAAVAPIAAKMHVHSWWCSCASTTRAFRPSDFDADRFNRAIFTPRYRYGVIKVSNEYADELVRMRADFERTIFGVSGDEAVI